MKSILYIGNKLSHHGFTPGVIEILGSQLEAEGFNIYYAGTLKNQFLRLFQMIFKSFVIGCKADYILIDTYSTSSFWFAYVTGRIARFVGTKYIPILHGGELPLRLKKSKRSCDKLFKNSYVNVAVSGYLENEFKKAGYTTLIIPNPINIASYNFKLRKNPRPKILWVRSFSLHNNPNMAIDLMVNLLKKWPDAELCMVGPDIDGCLSKFKSYAKEKQVEDRIKITGKLTKTDWITISTDYDFFINTTNIDNTPVSVIEALALGLLVVSTNPGGIPFLLTDELNSYLVNPGDSNKMFDKIDLLINNPLRFQEITLNGRKLAENYDWQEIKYKWLDLLI
jgi:glycosyltransferase involved in cell wall biosynthesis